MLRAPLLDMLNNYAFLPATGWSVSQFTCRPLDVSLGPEWRQRTLCCDWCVSEPSVHDLSPWTRSSSIMSRGASLSKPKQENISLFLRFSPRVLIPLTFSQTSTHPP